MSHTTVPLEAIGTLVRTLRTADGGGFLVAEFYDSHGNLHTEEAKANARLFVAAAALHGVAEQALAAADINTSPALIQAATEALASSVSGSPAAHQRRTFEQLAAEFDPWWERCGQFCRAGGGGYEKTFAFYAWHAALGAAGVELPSESHVPVQGNQS